LVEHVTLETHDKPSVAPIAAPRDPESPSRR
jgi:hypothetical protein